MDYVAPETVADACRALEGDGSHCLAGGQSLIAMMNLGLATPERLVSLRRIAELRGIDPTPDGGLRIGAMTTHAELATLRADSPAATLLAQAARVVAYPAVRNRGTLGGSLALADPAADYPVALVAIDAIIELVSATGRRTVPAREFFRGMFDTALVRGEIVAAIQLPGGPARAGTAYEKLSLVAGDFAILSVAAIAGKDLRVAIGGYAMKPVLVSGLDVAGDVHQQAARELARLPAPPADQRASAGYRRRVAPELVRRAVRAAAMNAQHD
jgi:carbon-monoxide dehydrogenase medium subunit